MSEFIDQVREGLRKFKGGAINPRQAVQRIADKAGLTQAEVRLALKKLREAGEVHSDSWDPIGNPQAKLLLNLPSPPPPAYETHWLERLAEAGLHEREVLALSPVAHAVKQMPPDDQAALIQGLCDLRDDQENLMGQRAFNVSARYLLGSSKLLNLLPTRALEDFGIKVSRFRAAPRNVIIAGSSNPKSVVLVENPHAFEAAVEADQGCQICWVATFGYGLSKKGEEFGDQLAEVICSNDIVELQRRGDRTPLKKALEHSELFFWGDLDLAGLDIFCRLRKQLPHIRLSAFYTPMVDVLVSRHPQRSHHYQGVGKNGQKLLGGKGDPLLAFLAGLCEERGVDQEAINPFSELLMLADQAYTCSNLRSC